MKRLTDYFKNLVNKTRLKSQRGYILLSLTILTALMPMLILIGLNYTDVIAKGGRNIKSHLTKTRMLTIRNVVASKAKDVDSDGYYEVLKEGASNTVPASISVNSKDEWGTDLRYCTWDSQNCNQTDATYTQNNPNAPCAGVLPPSTNLVLRLISAGKDKTFQTDCLSVSSSGDDIMMDETEAGIRSGGGNGWIDDGNVVRLADGNDKVGIGTTGPSELLHVYRPTGFSMIKVETDGTSSSGAQLELNSNGSAGVIGVRNDGVFGASSNLGFRVGPTNAMVITDTGNVGIGTTTPQEQLHLGNGVTGGAIRLQGYSASGNTYGTISCNGDNCFFDNSYSSGIELFIQYNGNVGIGTTAPSYLLHVNGTAAAVSFVTLSDLRYKKDIVPLVDVIERVLMLNPVYYYYRVDEYPDKGFDRRRQIGLIAQEVEHVFPDLVSTDSSGYKSVAYDKLSVLLIEAVKELKKQVDGKKTVVVTENNKYLWIAVSTLGVMNVLLAAAVIVFFLRYKKTKGDIA